MGGNGMPEMATINLEIIKRAAMTQISKELAREVTVEVVDDPYFPMNQILVRTTLRLLALQAKEEVVFESEEVANGWWDHLILSLTDRFIDHEADFDEQRGFWWRLRGRANTHRLTKRSTIYHACPHLEVPPDAKRHIQWLRSVDPDHKDA
jgi:hypothetical protein